MNELHWLGLLIGMRHALDADHVAAVASLVTVDNGLNKKQALNHGMFWGIGHSVTLIVVASAVIIFGQTLPNSWAAWLEAGAGVMLILLSLSIFHRFLHSKAPTKVTLDKNSNTHKGRAFAVGTMHGLAGSSVLVMILMESIPDIWSRLFYLGLFSLGSIIGMVIVSGLISLPLLKTRLNSDLTKWLSILIAMITLFIGAQMLYSNLL